MPKKISDLTINNNPSGSDIIPYSNGADVTDRGLNVSYFDDKISNLDSYQEYINILSFGAKLDGTNESDIFETAIDYCVSNDRALFIPGEINVSGFEKTVSGNLKIIGAGRDTSKIKAGYRIRFSGNLELADISFEDWESGVQKYIFEIITVATTTIRVSNCFFSGARYGFYSNVGEESVIKDSFIVGSSFEDMERGGVLLNTIVENMVVDSCVFRGFGGVAVNTVNCVFLGAGTRPANGLKITNNFIADVEVATESTGEVQGILCFGSDILIHGNTLKNIGGWLEDKEGIYTKGSNVRITSNFCYNAAGTGDAVITLKNAGSSFQNIVANNVIVDDRQMPVVSTVQQQTMSILCLGSTNITGNIIIALDDYSRGVFLGSTVGIGLDDYKREMIFSNNHVYVGGKVGGGQANDDLASRIQNVNLIFSNNVFECHATDPEALMGSLTSSTGATLTFSNNRFKTNGTVFRDRTTQYLSFINNEIICGRVLQSMSSPDRLERVIFEGNTITNETEVAAFASIISAVPATYAGSQFVFKNNTYKSSQPATYLIYTLCENVEIKDNVFTVLEKAATGNAISGCAALIANQEAISTPASTTPVVWADVSGNLFTGYLDDAIWTMSDVTDFICRNNDTVSNRGFIDFRDRDINSAVITGNTSVGKFFEDALTAGQLDDFFIRHNKDYVTENAGTATITSANTVVTVTHGLAFTPTAKNISVTPTNLMGSATKFSISTIGATTFNIDVDVAPGGDTATFAWQAQIK